ncbi:ribonuclease T [Methylocystis sp. B8]|uniref:ribonuclease T2 family protein n=1 Tax=Methylocystis sp. B8 TaxID=544938 RepID=UPI0010FD533A|nr:ribonuclease T [Methylocystis sp. B8]TLG79128.1 ribonuclease T [Methylocystis sp. B8]
MRRVFVRCAAWAVLICAVFAPGFSSAAKEGDCAADDCSSQPALNTSAGAARDFDFYVLALSWSPGFCQSVDGARDQCEPGKGLGFVVHGLWPQYESGAPGECAGAGAPSRVALEKAAGLFPDERLARYEWRKHGVCSGKSPSDYFADVAHAHAAVTIPPLFVKPARDQTFTPIDVERAFYQSNPRLRPGMMAVSCRRRVMDGVRICLSKDLREFRACPEVVRRGCHVREISAPAPL